MTAPAGAQQQLAAAGIGQQEEQQRRQAQPSDLDDSSSSINNTELPPVTAATAVDAPAADSDAEARVLQLLPGLSPAAVPAVAARMLDGAAVTMGRRLGCGAFATVYEAQLAGSRAKWVVKRLDRVAPEHAQQVRGRDMRHSLWVSCKRACMWCETWSACSFCCCMH